MRTFTHSDEGVSINGFFIPWEDFDKLEPSYHWDENYPARIYRVDGEVPSTVMPEVMLTQGAHILIEPNGTRHTQILPWPQGDEYCIRLPEYQKKLSEWAEQKKKEAFRKPIEEFKKFIRGKCVGAKTGEQKQELEDILQKIDDAWGKPLCFHLCNNLVKFYDVQVSE